MFKALTSFPSTMIDSFTLFANASWYCTPNRRCASAPTNQGENQAQLQGTATAADFAMPQPPVAAPSLITRAPRSKSYKQPENEAKLCKKVNQSLAKYVEKAPCEDGVVRYHGQMEGGLATVKWMIDCYKLFEDS